MPQMFFSHIRELDELPTIIVTNFPFHCAFHEPQETLFLSQSSLPLYFIEIPRSWNKSLFL